MPIEYREWGAYCKTCGQMRLFRASVEKPTHVLHALLTIFTCLLWGLVWLIVSLSATSSPWRCSVCGSVYQP